MQIAPKDRNMSVTLSVVKYECHGEEQYDQLATCKSSERYEAAEGENNTLRLRCSKKCHKMGISQWLKYSL